MYIQIMSLFYYKTGKLLFKIRSYTPVPFIVFIMVFLKPTSLSLILGLTLFVIGSVYRFICVAYAGPGTRSRDKGPDQLTVSGPFAVHRNPIYTGNIFIYSGIATISNVFFPYFLVIVFLFFFIQYNFIISFEEDFLTEKFGGEYLDYKQKGGRWLTSFSRKMKKGDHLPDFRLASKSERRTFQNYFLIMVLMIIVWLIKK